jgi:hypothetical protein
MIGNGRKPTRSAPDQLSVLSISCRSVPARVAAGLSRLPVPLHGSGRLRPEIAPVTRDLGSQKRADGCCETVLFPFGRLG